MKLSQAEMMHNRILAGASYAHFIRNVHAESFEVVASRAGTLGLPDVRDALAKLRAREKTEEPK